MGCPRRAREEEALGAIDNAVVLELLDASADKGAQHEPKGIGRERYLGLLTTIGTTSMNVVFDYVGDHIRNFYN
jgi:hypothetical protein